MTFALKVTWLLTFIALSLVIVPVLIYDITKPSSVCTNTILLPIIGCTGSFIFGQVALEHEAIGVGMILAAVLLEHSPLRIPLFVIGMALFLSDSFFPIGSFTDYVNNPQGSVVSGALGFTYAFVASELVHSEELGEVEIPV